MTGQEAVASINGPLANTIGGLELYARTVVGTEPWLHDPKMIPLPWREVTLPSTLAFGIVYDDGVVRPAPPIRRALEETADKLKKAGHEVIEWDVGAEYHDAPRRLAQLFLADGGKTIRRTIEASDEPWPAGLAGYKEASADPERDLVSRQIACLCPHRWC
jgi:amidase